MRLPVKARVVAMLFAAACLTGLHAGGSSLAATPPGPVAVIGDFGSGAPAERQVARMVALAHPAAVVTTGDNVYSNAGYSALVGDYYPSWAAAHRVFPATGNHDYAEGIAAFDTYFDWLHGRRTYAAAIGEIAFFVLDSQGALDSPTELSRQRAWLRAALATSTARWRVVVLHHPPYSSGITHGSSLTFRWPFAAWGADLVVSGHEHNYERFRKATLTYVVDGAGGKDLYRFGRPLPGSLARNDRDYGALLLQSDRNTLRGEFRTTSGRVADRFTITARRPAPTG
jgi:tartrate-resistant acid phosphatase type 5